MADQELRDKTGKLIGKIRILSDGKHELRDHTGKMLGTYNPKNNETRAANGSLVGKGNLVTTLL